MLIVCLLQDGAEEVREDMAASVGTVLSSLSQTNGKCLFSVTRGVCVCVYLCTSLRYYMVDTKFNIMTLLWCLEMLMQTP